MFTKTCKKCSATKPVSDFYGAGYGNSKCKECVKAIVRTRYRKNLSKMHAYDRRRNLAPKRRKAMTAAAAKHRAKYPDRYRARTAVSNAVRDGRLTKGPCEVCGAKKTQGHHDDYSKPLDVRWFCQRHHDAAHGDCAHPF